METQSDADPFYDGQGENSKKKRDSADSKPRTMSGNYQGGSGQAQPNKSFPFNMNSATVYTVPGPKKKVESTFNFNNSKILNAAIGNEGPTTFNSDHTTYKKGAVKQDIKITGGKFNQTTIGGKARYNNQGSTVSTGGGGSAKLPDTEFVDIDQYPHPYAPEEYLAKLLRTGVTSEELINLLERKYSIVNLAYAIPSSRHKREAMVKALITVADID